MPNLEITYAGETRAVPCAPGQLLGEVIAQSGFPLEQPCAGRGTCGKCKVIAEGGLRPHDAIEDRFLLAAERAAGMRLACRARLEGEARVTLAPLVVYSNKIFTRSTDFKRNTDPLGLAIDLGSTTVAALLVSLRTGEVYAGAAALNQQALYGADVIARLAAAEAEALTLSALAQASIYQAIRGLRLSRRAEARIERAAIVGNTAMHHLLMRLPVHTLAVMPFQPYQSASICDARDFFSTLFPPGARVALPPLIGGFVGSDTTACLAYFDFDRRSGPQLAIDLGTNGEVMVTDGREILVASTAAGPAFEGVNISCGTRAVDGAIVDARREDGRIALTTIGGLPAVGLTGSGLLSLVYALRQAGAVEASGRLADAHPAAHIEAGADEVMQVRLTDRLALTQLDIRELQKAKGAIRVAANMLMERLGLKAGDLERVSLTGAFGGTLNVEAALGLGLVPPVDPARVALAPNGAGLGAALFLRDEGLARGEALAARARHVELDLDAEFNQRFVEAMGLE
jgi:uncharacterized 2Fe-2S/4Fe-4S cluster protein (DUF4445 family)